MKSNNAGRNPSKISFNVPFYAQHYDFTCGPAALMMAMNYFDTGIPLNKELEMDIWRESNMVESYGTSRYGLAYSASKRSFSSSIVTNVRGIEWINKLRPPLSGINFQMLKFFFGEQKRRCLKLGVREKVSRITADLLRECLISGSVPLLLSNTASFSEENLPHWMTVTGVDQDHVYLNNPLGRGKRRKMIVRLDEFPTVNGYSGDECVIEVKKNRRHS